MVEVPKDKSEITDWELLEQDELFFPRNEKEELIPKKVFIEVRKDKHKIKVKEQKKDMYGKVIKDEEGNIIETEVEKEVFNTIKRAIFITPMPRGEWTEMLKKSKDGETTEDQDCLILEKHLIKPKVNAEELIKSGKHFLISTIITKILEYSSLMIEKDKKKS